MHTHRVLMVVTSAEMMGTAPEPTGVWLEEVAAPYYAFLDARCEITLASPQGGAAPVDARSITESSQTAATRRFAVDTKAQHALAHTLKLASLQTDQYDAIFFAGGHGTMQDFVQDASVPRALEQFLTMRKPTALVCHGPAALVNAKTPRGTPLVQGRRITCFSDEEERLVELDAHVPFLLESKLRDQGATLSHASGPFQPHVVVDEQLITGQNPASSIPVAEALIHQLRSRESAVAA